MFIPRVARHTKHSAENWHVDDTIPLPRYSVYERKQFRFMTQKESRHARVTQGQHDLPSVCDLGGDSVL